jgi:hypothetical protein
VAKRSLQEQQKSMGLYLRDPDHCAPPGEMDPARAQVYRDLVFANLSSLDQRHLSGAGEDSRRPTLADAGTGFPARLSRPHAEIR